MLLFHILSFSIFDSQRCIFFPIFVHNFRLNLMMLRYLILFILIFSLCSCKQDSGYHTVNGYAQGGSYTLKYSGIKSNGSLIEETPAEIKHLADSILSRINHSFSGYDSLSILSHINNSPKDHYITNDIFNELFLISQDLYDTTKGKIDIGAAPIFELWGFGFKNKESVSEDKIDSVLMFSGIKHFKILADGTLHKQDKRAQLNFNAIAQGYSCDLIAELFNEIGIENYLIEVGLEIYCKGLNPNGKRWRLGIDRPTDDNSYSGVNLQEIIELTNCGIATSGNYRKFYIKDGKKYSHTIDPISARPVSHNLLSATIVAPSATLADAYSTYCMILGLESSKEFIESQADLKGLLIWEQDGKLKTWKSANF